MTLFVSLCANTNKDEKKARRMRKKDEEEEENKYVELSKHFGFFHRGSKSTTSI